MNQQGSWTKNVSGADEVLFKRKYCNDGVAKAIVIGDKTIHIRVNVFSCKVNETQHGQIHNFGKYL